MHSHAWYVGQRFFQTYVANIRKPLTVVEIGSVDGSLRDHRTPNIVDYIGINSTAGPGVDIVQYRGYPYYYPLFDLTVDVVVSSSYFEYSEMVWMSYMEAMRILKPDGLLFCNIAKTQTIPVVDNQLLPATALGLEQWANLNSRPSLLLESKISADGNCFAVFVKDKTYDYCHRLRMFED